MSRGLSNENEMRSIYEASKKIYEGKYNVANALRSLNGKVSGTNASMCMYFEIYACMRNAKCYKMGTSEAFTKYLLNSIFQDSGLDAYINALSAVKGNYEYRMSVNNTQPSLVRACEDSLHACGIEISFEEIPAANSVPGANGDNAQIESLKKRLIAPSFDRESPLPSHTQNQTSSPRMMLEMSPNNLPITADVMEINIQPPASILNVFSRLSYKPWYAIAEFVDNSTQSYMSHRAELESAPGFEKLIVDVRYDAQKNTLTVKDNAFGMEIDRFKDAILLDSRNETQTGRNEFGMGLKTAASWFGKIWTVTSTQYGSENQYTATIDIPLLDEQHLQGTTIFRDHVASDSHGTEIFIEQVTKKITASRTIGKIRDLLSSMYRRDINSQNIEIWFNGEPIVFEEYPVLTNFRGKSWKKDLDFSVEFENHTYHVTGFVAIMNPGSFPKAGFALFRQDRVVIGGTDNNYKPFQIFGQAQSQKSLKLFGELNMNDFPVNQAKDGFIWDDGLEDAFINVLKDNIQEYINIAELSIKERASELLFSDQTSAELQQNVSETISSAFGNEANPDQSSANSTSASSDKNEIDSSANAAENTSDISEYIDTILNAEDLTECISTNREYMVPVTNINKVHFSVQWARGSRRFWIDYEELGDDDYEVKINIDHPFFMPFSKEDGFQKVLEKFAIAFVLAERQAKLASDKDGYIKATSINNHMNRYLEKLAEDEKWNNT
jgi:hypothetical protein